MCTENTGQRVEVKIAAVLKYSAEIGGTSERPQPSQSPLFPWHFQRAAHVSYHNLYLSLYPVYVGQITVSRRKLHRMSDSSEGLPRSPYKKDELGMHLDIAAIRTHRNNIHRYRRLLRTELSELERDFIDRRMADERTALDALVGETFPVTFPLPKDSSSTSSSMGAAS
jgi:hypothetical protein